MGSPTMNVGTVEGGSGVNLVPDLATIGVDIRTVPGMNHPELISRLKNILIRSRNRNHCRLRSRLDRAG